MVFAVPCRRTVACLVIVCCLYNRGALPYNSKGVRIDVISFWLHVSSRTGGAKRGKRTCPCYTCRRSSVAEQLFRKQRVVGSTPSDG